MQESIEPNGWVMGGGGSNRITDMDMRMHVHKLKPGRGGGGLDRSTHSVVVDQQS